MRQKLQIETAELTAAVTTLRRLIRLEKAGEAILSYSDGMLRMAAGGAALSVPATGHWQGEARVPARFFSSPPPFDRKSENVTLSLEGDRLHLGRSSINCAWQQPETGLPKLPMDPPFRRVLRLPLEHSRDQIEKAGLSGVVAEAEARRSAVVETAARALEPLGITRADVFGFVDGSLQREMHEERG
jgi:hypothetical protein